MPWWYAVTMLIPNYFGNLGTYNYWGPGDYVEAMLTVGTIPVFLALFSFDPRKKNHIVIFWIAVAVVSIVLGFRWWGTDVLYRLSIPLLSTSVPTRIFGFSSIAISILAGFGWDAMWPLWGKNRPRVVRQIAFYLSALGIIGIVSLLLYRVHAVCPTVLPACRMSAIRTTVLEGAAFVGFLLLLAVGMMRKNFRLASLVGIFCLIVGISWYNAAKYLPFSPPKYVMPEHPLIRALSSLAPNRVTGIGSAMLGSDLATYYHFADTNVYDPLYIKRYGELVSYVNSRNRISNLTRSDVTVSPDTPVSTAAAMRRNTFWDMTGTAYLVTKKSDALHTVGDTVWEDQAWRVIYRPTVLPRAYVVFRIVTEPDPDQELADIFSPQTNLIDTAFVEDPVPLEPNGFTGGSAHIESYTHNRIVVKTRATAPGLLVLSDTDYPGWKARVDGNETPVYRTNYAFRGVIVPSGAHTVLFYYDPASVRLGIAISILSVIVWVGVVWVGKRKSSKN